MSITIDQSEVKLFDSEVKQVYQEGYVLRGLLREKSIPGAKQIQFPVLGKGIARQKNIQDDVIPANVAHSNVTATMQDWHASEYTDIFKNNQISFDERQELVQALGMACGRRADKILIDAMAAATSSPTVGVNVGGTDSDMNYIKFKEAMGALDDNGVEQGPGRSFIMNWRAYRSLLADDEFINSDYTMGRRLDEGTGNIQRFLGFNIVCINDRIETDGSRLGLPKDGSDIVTLFGFDSRSVGIGYNMDMKTEINYDFQKLAFLTTCMFSSGAVAIDQTGIVRVSAKQA